MRRLCQGLGALIGLLVSLSWGCESAFALSGTPEVAPQAEFRSFTAFQPRPFAVLALAEPELASCFLLAPSWWEVAATPATLPDARAVASALQRQSDGVIDGAVLRDLAVWVAATEETAPAATGFGHTLLLLLPNVTPAGPEEIARVAAAVLFRAMVTPAAPDPRCSEPLLALAEAIAVAGSYSLLTLPPSLRPVNGWLEEREATPVLAAFAQQVLDRERSWASRRALTQQAIGWRGVSPGLAQAAALLLEAFGDPVAARQTPFSLLKAWREDQGGRFPPMPTVLKRALGRPLEAGLPKPDDDRDEHSAISRSAEERAIEVGDLPDIGNASSLPLSSRLLAAGRAREAGSPAACQWVLAGSVPAGLRTGCRSDEEEHGFVFSRPTATGGFEIVARTSSGEQALLLRRPGWVMSPRVVASRGELLFIDRLGIWAAALDGRVAPRLLARGSFRFLAVSPDGKTVASTQWPDGTVVLLGADGEDEVAVLGAGGIAWIAPDVLLASDGENLALVARTAETRPYPVGLPCTHGLAPGLGGAVAITTDPCSPGLSLISVSEGKVESLLELADAPLGVTVLADDSVVYSDGRGLWQWRRGEHPVRVGTGVTPGPG